jgi:hypothetical protein
MDVVLALDPATKCGFCIGVPGGKPVLGLVNFGHGRELDDHFDVFMRARCWINTQLEPNAFHGPVTMLAIERPVPPSKAYGSTNFDTTLISLGLFAIFGAAARYHGIRILPAHISSWRKYALGRGNLKGADAKRAMIRLVKGLGWGDVDHNAAEAGGIWLWACGNVAPERVVRAEPLFSGVAQ